MVYCDNWETFEKAAASIYASAPDVARYTIKYRNCDAALVLKVTDNATCVQLRTEKLEDIKKIAHLHRILAQTTSNRSAAIKELAPVFPEAPKEKTKPAASAGTEQQSAAAQGKNKARGKKRI
ncbi:hypothetical protein GGF37_004509 [Kickxella alabastrina]|uniref:Uncharacterized protein n=1 Tax=Kickxella alabastrina TaxID=61397 RepID=A0ACC1IS57_9FUNG|nr:hypothetical protein LPJ66_001871 [Kickxella alabastrina]KAJ1939158.1 hypothetical protein GGF37_004509 [Kickxella alabastrina]